jgi:hypothetical protein
MMLIFPQKMLEGQASEEFVSLKFRHKTLHPGTSKTTGCAPISSCQGGSTPPYAVYRCSIPAVCSARWNAEYVCFVPQDSWVIGVNFHNVRSKHS